jgi:hypothetical protein
LPRQPHAQERECDDVLGGLGVLDLGLAFSNFAEVPWPRPKTKERERVERVVPAQALIERDARGLDRLPKVGEEFVNAGRLLGELLVVGRGSGEAARHASAYDLQPSMLVVHTISVTGSADNGSYPRAAVFRRAALRTPG